MDSPQTAGVIIKIEREMFRILDQTGIVRSLKPSQISSKVSTKFAVATDAEGFDIRAGETMKETNPVSGFPPFFLRAFLFLTLDRRDNPGWQKKKITRITGTRSDGVASCMSTDPCMRSSTRATLSRTVECLSRTRATSNRLLPARTSRTNRAKEGQEGRWVR